MASNDGKKLTVFGLGFREHHGLRMQQLLREFQQLPTNPSDRTALFTGLFALAKELTDEQVRDIQPWLQNGGEFPKHVVPVPDVQLQQGMDVQYEDGDGDENEDEDVWPEYDPEAFADRAEELGGDEEQGGDDTDEGDEDAEMLRHVQDLSARYVAGNRLRRHSVGADGEAARMPAGFWAGPLPHAFQVPGRQAPVMNFGASQAPLPEMPFLPIPSPDLEQHASIPSGMSQTRDPDSTDIECAICAEFLPPSAFPASSKITERCDHNHETMACLNCIRQDIQTTLDGGMLYLLHCPFCHEILSYDEMKKYASPEAFSR